MIFFNVKAIGHPCKLRRATQDLRRGGHLDPASGWESSRTARAFRTCGSQSCSPVSSVLAVDVQSSFYLAFAYRVFPVQSGQFC